MARWHNGGIAPLWCLVLLNFSCGDCGLPIMLCDTLKNRRTKNSRVMTAANLSWGSLKSGRTPQFKLKVIGCGVEADTGATALECQYVLSSFGLTHFGEGGGFPMKWNSMKKTPTWSVVCTLIRAWASPPLRENIIFSPKIKWMMKGQTTLTPLTRSDGGEHVLSVN